MIKVFSLNKNGKIEISKEELQKLLDDSYWEGYRANSITYYTYRSPNVSPWSVTCNTASNTATISASDLNTTATNVKISSDNVLKTTL